MKSKTSAVLITLTVLVRIALPIRIAAQEQKDHHAEHHRYKFVDSAHSEVL